MSLGGNWPGTRGRQVTGRAALIAALALWLILWPGAVRPAAAAASPLFLVVTSTADEPDESPGDGRCRTASGACTLRAAIQETNALVGADTIVLPGGTYALTIPGADEDLAATGDLDV